MNGLTVRSKIHVWIVSLCFVGLLGAVGIASSVATNSLQSSSVESSAIASNHQGSNGGGG